MGAGEGQKSAKFWAVRRRAGGPEEGGPVEGGLGQGGVRGESAGGGGGGEGEWGDSGGPASGNPNRAVIFHPKSELGVGWRGGAMTNIGLAPPKSAQIGQVKGRGQSRSWPK